ncbi:hypothetical protein LTS09_003968 [Friedmanniomyces endolithicus]|nr:hypothetical protein LTS09_003968 [Friedmanniomyces endolithicus]
MATIQRTTTPPTEPFPSLDSAPRTPASLPGGASVQKLRLEAENPNLLRPRSQHNPLTDSNVSPKTLNQRGYSPRSSPAPLTGQAAMSDLKRRKQQQESVEARQISPNPAIEAMQSLMGGGGMSKQSDAPSPSKLSEPLRKVAEKISIPDTTHSDSLQVSPVSVGSFGTIGTLESTGPGSTMTATAAAITSDPQFVAEPAEMTAGASYPGINGHLAIVRDENNKAFSYPGPPPQQLEKEAGLSRGMSYPGIQGSPKSPASNKRHKCPYCSTDFTRHHNLKSHLLTHSQEKPYSRFRRLHDLKRHTKLHTGERPHTCDKCGRRFARGDALARHNKGPGGCAGRRSSFGDGDGDGDGDDYDGPSEGMDGVDYTGGDDDETGEGHDRRGSEPSRKRTHLETPQDSGRDVYRQLSSTYPPIQGGRPHNSSVSSMAPPTVIHPGSSTAASPRDMSGHPSPAASGSLTSSYYPPYLPPGQVFQQQGLMTESPKPLSPGQPADQHRLSVDGSSMGGPNRNRSPSLTTQFQQQHFGRGSGRGTPPQPPGQLLPGPILPPLPPGQPQTRPGLSSSSSLTGGLGPSSLHHQIQQVPSSSSLLQGSLPGSNPGSLSSQGRSSGSSMRDIIGGGGGTSGSGLGGGGGGGSHDSQADIWSYVRGLEARFSKMQEEYELRIRNLQDEVKVLKGQVAESQQQQQGGGSYSSEVGGGRAYHHGM